jgi:NAD(P)H-dependent flavin oxidoreductase YrpB (nitropropane dioxygenase family)
MNLRDSPLCELCGIELAIVQAPMANNAPPGLAAAVSAAGALGSVAGAALSPDELRAAIREVRAATDRPFAVNVFAPPYLRQETLDVVLAERPQVCSFSFGILDPAPLRERGIVTLGTAFLFTPEAGRPPEHLEALRSLETVVTDAYTGRPMRAARTPVLEELMAGPPPLPFPEQRRVAAEKGPLFMGGTGACKGRVMGAAELVRLLAAEATMGAA